MGYTSLVEKIYGAPRLFKYLQLQFMEDLSDRLACALTTIMKRFIIAVIPSQTVCHVLVELLDYRAGVH